MKKIGILVLAFLLLSGCGGNEKAETTPTPEPTSIPEATSTPEATPTIESGEKTEQETVDSAGAGQDTEVIGEPQFNEGSIEASYIENVDSSATTMTFHADNTLDVNLNVCSGMSELKGNYSLEDQVVTIWFEESTGYDFLDNSKFTFDLGADHSLTRQVDSEMFSCSGSDPESYSIRQ